MKVLYILLSFVITALPVRADNQLKEVRKQLKAQAEQWDRAIVAKDRAAIEANLDDGFRQIDGDGGQFDRAEFIADLMDPALQIDPYIVEDFEIRIFGDVALLSGRTLMTGSYNSKRFDSHYRYVDIYHQENGRWKVVNVQITRILQKT